MTTRPPPWPVTWPPDHLPDPSHDHQTTSQTRHMTTRPPEVPSTTSSTLWWELSHVCIYSWTQVYNPFYCNDTSLLLASRVLAVSSLARAVTDMFVVLETNSLQREQTHLTGTRTSTRVVPPEVWTPNQDHSPRGLEPEPVRFPQKSPSVMVTRRKLNWSKLTNQHHGESCDILVAN